MTAKFIGIRHRACRKAAPQGKGPSFWTALHDHEVNQTGPAPTCRSCGQPIGSVVDVTRIFEESLHLSDWPRLPWEGNPNLPSASHKAPRLEQAQAALASLAERAADLGQGDNIDRSQRKRLDRALDTIRTVLGAGSA